MTEKSINPQRGEIWLITFDPKVGEEIEKVRPALVVGEPALGRTGLRIVVPVLTDKNRHKQFPWFFNLPATIKNGLSHDSESDSSQVKSLSINRFIKKRGNITFDQLKEVVAAIALCIGYES